LHFGQPQYVHSRAQSWKPLSMSLADPGYGPGRTKSPLSKS
jgi:hypothetical protein